MTISWRLSITASLLAITLASSAAMAQPFSGPIQPPAAPPALEVPAGNSAFLKAHAVGTQNYICLPSASGFSWTFLGPQATLFVNYRWIQGEIRQQIATHFLSPNPAENGLPRPTWQSSFDTSAVWGRSIASSTDPAFVEPGAIAWLLLQVAGSQRGPMGGSMLSGTTFIQRVNTSGGVAPSTGCSQASNVGSTALVPYSTDYLFYKASR